MRRPDERSGPAIGKGRPEVAAARRDFCIVPDAATVVSLEAGRARRRSGTAGQRQPCSDVCTCWGAPLGGAL